MALIFNLPRGCDYLHQGAPQFPSNFLFCEISKSEWLWDPVSAGYRGFRTAKLPNPGGNEVSESMGLEVSESKLGQVSESGHVCMKFPNPGAWEFPNQSSEKFPNPGSCDESESESLGVSELELLQVIESAAEVSESGRRRVSESMCSQVFESDVEVSESEVGHPRIILVQTNMFRTGPPDKLPHPSSHIWPCKPEHFVHPLSLKTHFLRDLTSKTESGRCDNKAFAQDFLQIPTVKDVKTKLSCETSLKKLL